MILSDWVKRNYGQCVFELTALSLETLEEVSASCSRSDTTRVRDTQAVVKAYPLTFEVSMHCV